MIKYIIFWCATVMIPYGDNEPIDPKDVTEVDGVLYKVRRDCKNQMIVDTSEQRDSLELYLFDQGAFGIRSKMVVKD